MGKKCILVFKKMGLLLFAGVCLLLAVPAEAHRVNVFAWVEGDTVHTESRFSGGREVKEGQVAVYDEQTGEKLLEGRTDEAGKFSFKVPRKSALRIEMIAGMGHRNEWIVPVEEIAAAAGNAPPPAQEAAEKADRVPEASPEAPATPVSAAQIEKTLEKVLDRKLSPVVKMIAESRRDRTTVQEVVGGIGYIVGLAGLGVYIHYRRKIKEMNQG
jgi:nickel transport protein